MYHHILPNDSFIASSVKNFDKQMQFLSKNGYKTLSSEEFLRYKKQKLKVPKKSVFITFDDGWRDNYYYAYPVLKKYNLKATIFLVTEWIEKASEKKATFNPLIHNECKKQVAINPSEVVLNWDEVGEMSDVFDFHSHTHSHRDFYFKKYEWEEEFILSKEVLKKRLGISDKHLCWPRGRYNQDLVKLAKKYNISKSEANLIYNKIISFENEIKRIAVKKDDKWLKKQLFIFNNKILGNIYSKIKGK